MDIEQAINIAKGCVMASYMDRDTKQAVIEILSSVTFIYGYYKLNSDCNYCSNCGRKLKEDER